MPPGLSFVGRIVDLWGFVVDDYVAGYEARGPVLASAPRPISGVPSEIAGIVKGESGFVALHTETRWLDPYQLPGDVPTGPEILLEPVSAHLGRVAPRPAPSMTWWPWHDGLEITDEFWPCANFGLSLTAPHPEDRSLLERIAEIGVVPGMPWDSSVLPDEIRAAIREGMDHALNGLLDAASEPGAYGLGDIRREDMDRDYFRRAVGALRPLLQ